MENSLEREVVEEYIQGRPRCKEMYERACKIFPSGVNHDLLFIKPFPLFIERAEGSHIWDIDGNEYIDLMMAGSVMLLGHNPPAVLKAIAEQLKKGIFFMAPDKLQVEWASLIQRLIPSAERIVATNSGTEATLLAMRIARAYTGKEKILRFEGHYHGWHDYVMKGLMVPFDVSASAGVPADVLATTVAIPANDIAVVEGVLEANNDIAAVIIEPTGGSYGTLPLRPGFLQELREVTKKYGILLIFDELITGFRVSPGGAQAFYGVTPDLTTLGKIMGGGIPCGAVGGRAEFMEVMTRKADPHQDRYERAYHGGTFNASPLVCAAGLASLKILASGEPQKYANEVGCRFRDGLNDVARRLGAACCAYGDFSDFHLFFGECDKRGSCDRSYCSQPAAVLRATPSTVASVLRHGLELMGVAIRSRTSGLLSAAHTDADIEQTLQAFEDVLKRMLVAGLVARD